MKMKLYLLYYHTIIDTYGVPSATVVVKYQEYSHHDMTYH